MYVVIFTAEIAELDDEYTQMAQQLRHKALTEYRCQKFISYSENQQEIALSYWLSPADIQAWKNDDLHRQAQHLGKTRWYKHYRVEVCEITHQYAISQSSQGTEKSSD